MRFLGDNNEHVSRCHLFFIPVLHLYFMRCQQGIAPAHPFGEFDIAKGVHKNINALLGGFL